MLFDYVILGMLAGDRQYPALFVLLSAPPYFQLQMILFVAFMQSVLRFDKLVRQMLFKMLIVSLFRRFMIAIDTGNDSATIPKNAH